MTGRVATKAGPFPGGMTHRPSGLFWSEASFAMNLQYDTPADATEFFDAYTSIAGNLPFAASVHALPGGDLLVVHATSDDIADRVVEAAG